MSLEVASRLIRAGFTWLNARISLIKATSDACHRRDDATSFHRRAIAIVGRLAGDYADNVRYVIFLLFTIPPPAYYVNSHETLFRVNAVYLLAHSPRIPPKFILVLPRS